MLARRVKGFASGIKNMVTPYGEHVVGIHGDVADQET